MNFPRVSLVIPIVAVLALAFSLGATAAQSPAPAAAPAAESALITATGAAFITSDAAAAATQQTLWAMVQASTTLAGAEAAVGDVQKRLAAIQAALEKAGVPAGAIHSMLPSVSTQKGDGLMVSGSLQAEVADMHQLVAALAAASASGATQVNAGGKQMTDMTIQPSDAALAKGMADATASARSIALSLANATGKRLGAVHSVSASQLSPGCCGPQGSGWNLVVTVSYEVAN